MARGGLGRLVEHDERSRSYVARAATTIRSVSWRRHCRPYDQGQLGACTGFAMAGLLMTEPFWRPSRTIRSGGALALYAEATGLDAFDGTYPPDDTGSSGLAVAKAARARGWIAGYRHAFGRSHVLGALMLGPVIIGVNWYSSFDDTDAEGRICFTPTAVCEGGHEFELIGVDAERGDVLAVNSWGRWGAAGSFRFSYEVLERLLREEGDCVTVH